MPTRIHSIPEAVYNIEDRPSKIFTAPMPTQRNLYQSHDGKLRECLREDIDAWAKGRYPGLDARTMYAEAMSLACEEHISRSTVNNWCSNDGNQFPLNKLRGHLMVTGRKRIAEIACDGTNVGVCNREDSLYSQMGRLEEEVLDRQRKIELIKLEIREAKA